MQVIWDETKAALNLEKHGVSFVEAQTVLDDIDAIYLGDPDSAEEQRWVVIGMSELYRVLVVVTWESEDDEVIRMISARKANRDERAAYEGGRA